MIAFFHTTFYQPLFNALITIYNALPVRDFGVAVILLTVLIRFILLPLFYKGAKDQAIMQRLAPTLRKLKEKHKNDRQAQAKAMFALYREHRVNPMIGFLLLLVQLPVLFALYQVFLGGLSAEALRDLYSFVPAPDVLNESFLGIVDLSAPSIVLGVLAGASQLILGLMTLPAKPTGGAREQDPATQIGRQMAYIGPVFIVITFIYFDLPAAVGLYWLTTTAFSVIQQVVINRRLAVSS